MSDEAAVLLSVEREGAHWIAAVSFRGEHYTMSFEPDEEGDLREVSASAFTLTIEGHEIGRLVDRRRRGETLSLPQPVEPPRHGPRLPSIQSESWRPELGPLDVWLDAVVQVSPARFVANLRIDGEMDVYEVEVRPGPVLWVVRSPRSSAFHSYAYDLQGMLLRMVRGERFLLPFKLRPRWPTPEPPPSRRQD